MIDLDLLGIGADGESLVFTDADGQRYSTPITDDLRGAVRRDRPRIEAVADRAPLRPRDIQALLRAGASAHDIAHEHDLELSQVTRFEAPVQAEKDYALARALAAPIGDAADAPIMGDLVVDRLAARGVLPSSLTWSACRDADAPWNILLTFIQGNTELGARWQLTSSGHMEALDEEARWLTETAAPAPVVPAFTPLPLSDHASVAHDDDLRAREALIDQLNAARGKPQEVEYDLDEDEEAALSDLAASPAPQESFSARIHSLTGCEGRTAPSADTPVFDSSFAAMDEAPSVSASPFTSDEASSGDAGEAGAAGLPPSGDAEGALPGGDDEMLALPGLSDLEPGTAPAKKSKRRSVPSWDEIVFGSKSH